VYSLNRAVVVLRAMVIGKCREMYSEIFSFYFRNAMMHGLDAPVKVPRTPPFGSPPPSPVSAPPVEVAPVVAPGRPRAKTPFVAVLLDFETAEHDGAFRAMSRTFGGSPADFHGRSIGCRVHFIGFLLKKCGNDIHHPFFRSVVALRDSPPAGGMTEAVACLSALKDTANAAGETKQATALKWLLHNRAAREAAFPLSSCALSRTEVLAAGQTTNAIESLNRQTQLEVQQQGSPALLGAIRALMDFDATTMLEVLPKGQAFSVGGSSERARLVRNMRRRQRNAVPRDGAPPKNQTPRKMRKVVGGARQGPATSPASVATAAGAAAVTTSPSSTHPLLPPLAPFDVLLPPSVALPLGAPSPATHAVQPTALVHQVVGAGASMGGAVISPLFSPWSQATHDAGHPAFQYGLGLPAHPMGLSQQPIWSLFAIPSPPPAASVSFYGTGVFHGGWSPAR